MSPPPAHRATTADLQAVYPFVTDTPSGGGGPLLGTDVLGAPFCFDPWDRYGSGELTGPNMVVVGQIGRGKSSLVKLLAWREIAFGRQAWVIDPKGEYGPLAEACGTVPLRLEPGGALRLNPLDVAAAGGHRGAAELLASVASASLERRLEPAERAALDAAVEAAVIAARSQATLPAVVAALLDPGAAAAGTLGTTPSGLASDGRAVALELRRLVEGDLAGMFDGPTTPGVSLDAPLSVLDLSALYRSPALGILMTCAAAWMQSTLAGGREVKRLVVVDEAWAVLHDLATARWLQASFKLSRSLGTAYVAVLHRLSDLRGAGRAGSEQERLAEGLLADAETRVVFAQPPSETAEAGRLLGLSGAEEQILAHLPRGVALWRIGARSVLVRHRVGAGERSLVDTDAAMRDPAPGQPGSGGSDPAPAGRAR